jgi:hypothetical protein
MELWNNELLQSIHKLRKSEISQVNYTSSDLNAKFLKIEESQKYLSATVSMMNSYIRFSQLRSL